jgi:apolipoprotein D and lipocalin family protein
MVLISTHRAVAESEENGPVTTVERVDLERYTGLWYEIARIPNRFQKQCARGTTAEYTLREDRRLDVMNRCFKENGDRDEAKGLAKIVDSITQAKLKVSFVSFLGWRPFWGDYWIIGLDATYQWAVVGSPDRAYGWILARTQSLDEASLEQIFAILERNGYDRSSFQMSAQ